MNAYPIIGMSPGNSYFKDEEIRYLLQKVIGQYGECAVLVADVPAIATYEAMGYAQSKARNKAIPKGNNLKNRTRRILEELGIDASRVRIVDWAEEVENNAEYKAHFASIQEMYKGNHQFAVDARATTQQVLEGSGKMITDMVAAVEHAVHYLLSEFAFLEWAPSFFDKKEVAYVYHNNWPVYEKYVAGAYDSVQRPHLGFILLENPYETFKPLQEGATYHVRSFQEILKSGVLRASFSHYPPAFVRGHEGKEHAGMFYDVLVGFASEHRLQIEWIEETGYGVIIDGLNQGRFDVFASTVWPTPERKLNALFTKGLYTSPVHMWVREGEAYTDGQAHSAGFIIAVREDDISDSIRKADYAHARVARIPQLETMDALLGLVSNGIADATFAEPAVVEAYNKHATVRLVPHAEFVREYENCFMLQKNAHEMVLALDAYIASFVENQR